LSRRAALAGWTALHLDRAHRHPDAAERARSDALVALLTPVVKAGFTDLGFEATVQAQQVFGGHGYIREWGMEQFVRDAASPRFTRAPMACRPWTLWAASWAWMARWSKASSR
jgi:alkylation response protein AidB-like acyl-CoA dehydrogenase